MQTQIAKATLNSKSKARAITILGFRTYFRTVIIKSTWYKTRHVEHCDRIETTEINLDKRPEVNPSRKDGFFNKLWWQRWVHMYRCANRTLTLHLIQVSAWNGSSIYWPDANKLLEEHIREILIETDLGKAILEKKTLKNK